MGRSLTVYALRTNHLASHPRSLSLVPSVTRFPTVHPLSYPAPCSLHSATVVSFVHSTPLRSVPQGRGDRGTKEPSTEGAGRGVEG